ncbi:MAG: hypothetical protein ACU0BN_06855 [Sulfitobacter sp.]
MPQIHGTRYLSNVWQILSQVFITPFLLYGALTMGGFPILVAFCPNARHFDSARMRRITLNLEKMAEILGYWFQLAEKTRAAWIGAFQSNLFMSVCCISGNSACGSTK